MDNVNYRLVAGIVLIVIGVILLAFFNESFEISVLAILGVGLIFIGLGILFRTMKFARVIMENARYKTIFGFLLIAAGILIWIVFGGNLWHDASAYFGQMAFIAGILMIFMLGPYKTNTK